MCQKCTCPNGNCDQKYCAQGTLTYKNVKYLKKHTKQYENIFVNMFFNYVEVRLVLVLIVIARLVLASSNSATIAHAAVAIVTKRMLKQVLTKWLQIQ